MWLWILTPLCKFSRQYLGFIVAGFVFDITILFGIMILGFAVIVYLSEPLVKVLGCAGAIFSGCAFIAWSLVW